MSQSQAVAGYGSSIAYATVNPSGSWIKVAQTMDVATPEAEVGDIKITNNDSPNNTHEYLPGLLEPGEMEFKVTYFKSGHEALLNMLGNQTVYNWQETFTDTPATVCTFAGYLKSAKVEGKTEDGAYMGTIKVKATSKPIFT